MDAYPRLLAEALTRLGIGASEMMPMWHPSAGYRLPATPRFYANRLLEDQKGIPIDIHVYLE